MASPNKYSDIVVDIIGQIGIIKVPLTPSQPEPKRISSHTLFAQFNRPKALNSFGGKLIENTIAAIRELNENPDTVFTVLTGEGRFFSAGADVKCASSTSQKSETGISC